MKNIFKLSFKILMRLTTYLSPTLNTKIRYFRVFHKPINLKNPKTLNEKILWLKLNTYSNNSLVKECADKYKVRDYIQRIGCGAILNDLIAVYDNANDINWDSLPKQFVIKLNVGSGCNIIVLDKNKLDINETTAKLKNWMKQKYYLEYSEIQYKNVKPYILIEKYLKPEVGTLPDDYKFYCINGKAEYVMVCIGRENGGHPKFYFYDRNWNFIPFDEKENPHFPKPKLLDMAFNFADKLSAPFPFVRTDLYLFDNSIYFGELTFTSSGGFDNEISNEGLNIMGNMINLNYRNKSN